MADYYLQSSNIDVFPTSKRDDKYDRNARLTSEQNLVSMVNRLTKTDSFVISGLNISSTTGYLRSGSCNIGGYYFKIKSDIRLSDIGTARVGDTLYFKLGIKKTVVSSPENITFEEIAGGDSTDASPKYQGLSLILSSTQPETVSKDDNTITYKYLAIGKYTSSGWENADNGISFDSTQTAVTIKPNIVNNITTETKMSLQSFISDNINNLIIDDGELR